jgi:membrane-bound serine protease (ClpP class)
MMALTVGAIVRGQRRRPYTGLEALVGQVATARTVLNPAGLVFVNGELWDARSLDGRVEPGEEVKIEEVKGPTLLVRRVHPPEVKVLPGEEKPAPPEAEELPEPAIVQKEGANA